MKKHIVLTLVAVFGFLSVMAVVPICSDCAGARQVGCTDHIPGGWTNQRVD